MNWNYDMASVKSLDDIQVSVPYAEDGGPGVLMAYRDARGVWYQSPTGELLPRGYGTPYAWMPCPEPAEVRHAR